ncbi:hypothetical protein [Psychrobacillus sp. NPDC096623]|uniref:hypothetical protein n=1 Tax=Psychrobacillus sp. NPDC096623 TaxID=3364492 RepID=UPI0038205D2D
MKIDEAIVLRDSLDNYIKIYEEFKPVNYEDHVIHAYARLGNVAKTAAYLNEMGYRFENGRKLIANDISTVIRKVPTNELHALVAKNLARNVKKNPYL